MNGTHRQHGVLALWGAGVKPGSTTAAGMPDIAPTLLHLMGEGIPAHMDGRVLTDALMSAQTPVETVALPLNRQPSAATSEEARAIRQRLERLGYL
jgi:arylsulfatase A-like enzyme